MIIILITIIDIFTGIWLWLLKQINQHNVNHLAKMETKQGQALSIKKKFKENNLKIVNHIVRQRVDSAEDLIVSRVLFSARFQ